MTLFPLTPRQLRGQASKDSLLLQQPASAPSTDKQVRKASSFSEFRKRVVPASVGRVLGAGAAASREKAPFAVQLPYPVSAAQLRHPIAGPSSATLDDIPSTPTSTIAPSVTSRESMETVGVSAYLRVRPRRPEDGPSSVSNIQILSDTQVCMSAPSAESANTMPRSSSLSSFNLMGLASGAIGHNQSSTYSFNEVFPESTDQAALFSKTALPLVSGLLGANDADRMENALIFAYGVSGGGKTHTVQGISGGEPGILPRALDTIMNSIGAKQTRSHLRPCRLSGLEIVPKSERTLPGQANGVTLDAATVRKTLLGGEVVQLVDRDPTTLTVSDKYEYSIWASYAEIYNEKVFDLFDANDKRKPLPLKTDRQAGNKYIQGLREIRIWSNEDAQRLLRDGQINRQVFATRVNGASSRSHSIFTVKVVRLAKGVDPEDPAAHANLARLSIVDLAGSERRKNADTKGDRLKEAGNINKSLMVLGQCMEVMRRNQEERARGRKTAIVPFRHSKLTELFQSFFCGDGKAVLVAAINPYSTSYEENVSVLRFAAVASKVATQQTLARAPSSHAIPQLALPRYQQPLQPRSGRQPLPSPALAKGLPVLPSLQEDDSALLCETSAVEDDETLEYDDAPATPYVQQEDPHMDYIEEDDDDEELEQDAWEEALLDEIRYLRREVVKVQQEMAQQRYEHRVAQEEARLAASDVLDKELDEHERMTNIRIEDEVIRQEQKCNRKIDILVSAHKAEIKGISEEYRGHFLSLQEQLHRIVAESEKELSGLAAEHQKELSVQAVQHDKDLASQALQHESEMSVCKAEIVKLREELMATRAASTSAADAPATQAGSDKGVLAPSRSALQTATRRSLRSSTAGKAATIPATTGRRPGALESERAVEMDQTKDLQSDDECVKPAAPVRKVKLRGKPKSMEIAETMHRSTSKSSLRG